MPKTLEFPWSAPPKAGEAIEIRPGIFWARLALPFRLNHVNIYLVEDGAGLALIDTGIDNQASRAAWEALLEGPLAGRKLTRVIATHFHPDHIGLAGWLCERFDLALAMSQTEYLMALNIRLDPEGPEIRALSQLLPLARAQRRKHRDPARPRPELSAHGVDAAEDVSAAHGRRTSSRSAAARSR